MKQAKAAVIRVEIESDFIEISVFLVKISKSTLLAVFCHNIHKSLSIRKL